MMWQAAEKKTYLDNSEMAQLVRSCLVRSLAATKWYSDFLNIRESEKIWFPTNIVHRRQFDSEQSSQPVSRSSGVLLIFSRSVRAPNNG
ncbi:unnamed protein product [Caenorhabditis sp. 36 PRJEB53466]|nr:unnamed protein product [Caenorhabditis sp. 36 PRJEB53466]